MMILPQVDLDHWRNPNNRRQAALLNSNPIDDTMPIELPSSFPHTLVEIDRIQKTANHATLGICLSVTPKKKTTQITDVQSVNPYYADSWPREAIVYLVRRQGRSCCKASAHTVHGQWLVDPATVLLQGG